MTSLPEITRLRQVLDMLSTGQWLRLYQNDARPGPQDTGREYEEVIAPGYAPARMDFSDWRVLFEQIDGAEQGFLFLSPPFPTIYGYLVTERITDRFLWADRFDEPVIPTTGRFELYVTPCLRLLDPVV